MNANMLYPGILGHIPKQSELSSSDTDTATVQAPAAVSRVVNGNLSTSSAVGVSVDGWMFF
jgi:hypothetical protein